MLTLTTSVVLQGSPLPPPVAASASPNGRFLVVQEWEFDSPDQTKPRRILGRTFHVLETEQFINSRDRLLSSAPFYSESWQVRPEVQNAGDGAWPMVSNDGRSLVLVGVIPAMPGQPVMQIYRRDRNSTKLVRTFYITDLWTPAEVGTSRTHMDKGYEPQWFANGSLNISTDSQELIYRKPSGSELLIDLATGSVRHKP